MLEIVPDSTFIIIIITGSQQAIQQAQISSYSGAIGNLARSASGVGPLRRREAPKCISPADVPLNSATGTESPAQRGDARSDTAPPVTSPH